MERNAKKEWDAYVARERARVEPHLARAGFAFDEAQPQTIGERYLTRPVGGGRKVVFFGTRAQDGMRVVIKTSGEAAGVAELAREQRTRAMLVRIRFAYEAFFLPATLMFDRARGILITEYIAQETPFLNRPLTEQFSIALHAFQAQEAAHATTSGHVSAIAEYYLDARAYKKISAYAREAIELLTEDAKRHPRAEHAQVTMLDRAVRTIADNEETLERYGGFLTHWDFIPQNFRIRDGKLYLLDLTSIRFGNKYEGWARFINFMTLYHPPLAQALVAYVRLNRAGEELLALKLMRVYRLVELIRYYATWLAKTEGATRELARARITFWTDVLGAVFDDRAVGADVIKIYQEKRDALRSDDEKIRQKDLH